MERFVIADQGFKCVKLRVPQSLWLQHLIITVDKFFEADNDIYAVGLDTNIQTSIGDNHTAGRILYDGYKININGGTGTTEQNRRFIYDLFNEYHQTETGLIYVSIANDMGETVKFTAKLKYTRKSL